MADRGGGEDAAEVDGRVLRSVRSRERILDALTELIAEGDMQPTGERVAERAGYGLRTVYRHFEDMEGLYREMQVRVSMGLQPEPPAPEGSLEERIQAVVQRRFGVFERAAPFLRSGACVRWKSSFLTQANATMVRTLRDDLLRSLPEVDPYRDVVELLTSFEAWDRLRTDQKLGRDRTRRVVEEAVAALLEGSAPAKGRTSR